MCVGRARHAHGLPVHCLRGLMFPESIEFCAGEEDMLKTLWNDEAGFIVSAELVLVATLLVIGLIVGLSEVQHAVVTELNDVADAIGELNQSYSFSGFHKRDNGGQIHAVSYGSCFTDTQDDCDNNQGGLTCDAPSNETPRY